MWRLSRRRARALAVAMALLTTSAAAQVPYPSKAITFIIGFQPGGATDIIGRLIAQRLGEVLGQPVLVENRGGANGLIASNLTAAAAPDGYTIHVASMGLATNPYLYTDVKRNPLRDFTPVSLLAMVPNVVVVSPALPVADVHGLLELARTRGTRITSGTTGQAAPGHLATELLQRVANVKFEFIAYKGSAPALTDIVAGRIDMSLPTVVSSLAFIRAGKLRALAVTGDRRTALLPDVPTLAELKLLEHGSGWYGLVGPAGMPGEVVARLGEEVVRIMREPAMRERFVNTGSDPVGSTPREMATFIAREYQRWGELIRGANIRGEGQ